MLHILRTIRRWLAGALLVLLAGAWLSAAAAPCIAAMDAPAYGASGDLTGPHSAGMHTGMHGNEGGEAHAMHDCPHCDQAAAPCMDKAQDCELPQSLVPPAHKEFKFQPALILVADILPPQPEVRLEAPVDISAAPPRAGPPFTTLYCSFQE